MRIGRYRLVRQGIQFIVKDLKENEIYSQERFSDKYMDTIIFTTSYDELVIESIKWKLLYDRNHNILKNALTDNMYCLIDFIIYAYEKITRNIRNDDQLLKRKIKWKDFNRFLYTLIMTKYKIIRIVYNTYIETKIKTKGENDE
jgi:hypothetical protein